jgi:hypothetical protein
MIDDNSELDRVFSQSRPHGQRNECDLMCYGPVLRKWKLTVHHSLMIALSKYDKGFAGVIAEPCDFSPSFLYLINRIEDAPRRFGRHYV